MSLNPVLQRAMSLACLALISGALAAAAVTVSVNSSPPAEAIRPDHDMAQVTLAAQDNGQPVKHGRIQVKVTAPPHPKLLSTDFPLVEATSLLELTSDLKDGAFSFDYLFPIRGAYQFDVALEPIAGLSKFAPTSIQTSWSLNENPLEIRNVWLLIAGLFILGGVFGLMMARSAQAKSALLLAALAASAAFGMRVEGNVQAPMDAAKTQQVVSGDNGWALQVDSTPAEGMVGQPVRFDISLTKDSEALAEETELTVELHHIEDGKPIFKTKLLAPEGRTSQALQFFDGAPHHVVIAARAANHQGGSAPLLKAEFDMEVHGIHPPMAIKLRTMALLIGVLVVGMVAGWFCPLGSKEPGGAPIR